MLSPTCVLPTQTQCDTRTETIAQYQIEKEGILHFAEFVNLCVRMILNCSFNLL